ncbi:MULTISPECIES: HlyD family efflux transporter periplasmic adaptor subunit [Xanthomonas]|uniref:HlyD family secretion protein n=1 Tax=Xanthomonas TaxID=338 RepID=UPI0012633BBC|nr:MULTISPECIES: HlyD family efflux transporter periplasmic adaptor subunit [Xanthomonas]KAB7778943.1 anibiotic ABC transporter [Xanthomonas sp. LMG 12459]MCW0455918.1 Colicin V secretion protein CvaA [Xanthomonas sacchari]
MEARQREWLGTIMVATPPSRWVTTLLAASFASALICFLIFGHYTRRETVAGQLVPRLGILNVFAPSAGTITKVLVQNGQVVKAGDELLEISDQQDSSALGDTHKLVAQQLVAQHEQLISELGTQQAISQQSANALRGKVILLRQQLTQINEQMTLVSQQIDGAQRILDRMKPLEKNGYISPLQIQQQQAAIFTDMAEYKSLVRQQLDARQQIDAGNEQLTRIPLEAASKRGETERQIANVLQSIAQNEGKRALILRSPRDGVVSTLLLNTGQMVNQSQPLLSILPAGSALQAQLLVPSRAIGFVTRGSRVVLRYQAFPYQKFGQQFGRVTEISRSALSTAEVETLTGQQAIQNQEPLYRVQVTLDSQQVMIYGRAESVKAGMALEADILVERRTLLEWAFEPLYGVGWHFSRIPND